MSSFFFFSDLIDFHRGCIEDLLEITRTAIDAAFINETEKGKLYAKIDSWEYSG